MGDLQLNQEPALDTAIPAQTVLNKPDTCEDSSAPSLPREHTLVIDQTMNSEVRAPEKPRDLHQSQAITKDVVSRTLKGKEKEWAAVAEKKRPLQLLDLPVDILREIVGHVSAQFLDHLGQISDGSQLPHTNDLTSLALCHSILHALTIPCIYSRFDIVWPERSESEPTRAGVDALTYGLSTLVMAEELFGEAPWQRRRPSLLDEPLPGSESQAGCAPLNLYQIPKRRRGNNYAQYTKKFSLGNGPPDWVQEYSITKEGGKMLGTLVALAVARMRNLEAFIWDMPTGVLRDIWLALSSLADRDDGQDCRLEKVWIRWHNNTEMAFPNGVPPPPPQINVPPPPISVPHAAANSSVPNHPPLIPMMDLIEYPTFSVLPPLKSLSVLDIDELPYLDEMSILIARSQCKLKELRVGIAQHAHNPGRMWVSVWEGENFQQVDYSSTWPIINTIGEKRLGGVLGVLVGRVYNLRNNADTQKYLSASRRREPLSILDAATAISAAEGLPTTQSLPASSGPLYPDLQSYLPGLAPDNETVAQASSTAPDAQNQERGTNEEPGGDQQDIPAREQDQSPATPSSAAKHNPLRPAKSLPPDNRKHGPYLSGRLQLETLELERVLLSVEVLQHAFDWSILTNLTLLYCQDHELLWKTLRRNFSPTSPYMTRHSESSKSPGKVRLEYGLNLKKVHTNTVTPSLISFLKETLAPNSLEVLFLQEARDSTSSVAIDAIYRGPIRRHRASLKKLLIDSSGGEADDAPTNSQWRHWMLNHEIVTYITSGKMSNLRELGITLEYQDWVC